MIEGSINYGGKTWQGGKTTEEGTYMFIQSGADVGEISTDTGGTFFVIELPLVADMEGQRARETAAAE